MEFLLLFGRPCELLSFRKHMNEAIALQNFVFISPNRKASAGALHNPVSATAVGLWDLEYLAIPAFIPCSYKCPQTRMFSTQMTLLR